MSNRFIIVEPQAYLVLQHLRQVGHITNVEANAVLKVRSVSRRITDLIRAGCDIIKEARTDSTGQRYTRYVLRESPLGIHANG